MMDVQDWVQAIYGINFTVERHTTNYWQLNFHLWILKPYSTRIELLHLALVHYVPEKDEYRGPKPEKIYALAMERMNAAIKAITESAAKSESFFK